MAPRLTTVLALFGFALSSLAFSATPYSPCASSCQGAGSLDTHTSELSCDDADHASSADGVRWQNCVACLLDSIFFSGDQTDQSWLLYNLRISLGFCVLGYNGTAIANKAPEIAGCNTAHTCGPLQQVFADQRLLYDYCTTDGSAFSDANYKQCLTCLRQKGKTNYLANYLVILEAGCQQKPAPGKKIQVSDSLFPSSVVRVASKPSSAPARGRAAGAKLEMSVKVAIAVAGFIFLVLIVISIFLYYRYSNMQRQIPGSKPTSHRSSHKRLHASQRESGLDFKCASPKIGDPKFVSPHFHLSNKTGSSVPGAGSNTGCLPSPPLHRTGVAAPLPPRNIPILHKGTLGPVSPQNPEWGNRDYPTVPPPALQSETWSPALPRKSPSPTRPRSVVSQQQILFENIMAHAQAMSRSPASPAFPDLGRNSPPALGTNGSVGLCLPELKPSSIDVSGAMVSASPQRPRSSASSYTVPGLSLHIASADNRALSPTSLTSTRSSSSQKGLTHSISQTYFSMKQAYPTSTNSILFFELADKASTPAPRQSAQPPNSYQASPPTFDRGNNRAKEKGEHEREESIAIVHPENDHDSYLSKAISSFRSSKDLGHSFVFSQNTIQQSGGLQSSPPPAVNSETCNIAISAQIPQQQQKEDARKEAFGASAHSGCIYELEAEYG